ncbi:hypothetical protein D3C80_1825610 [compost metagenome]
MAAHSRQGIVGQHHIRPEAFQLRQRVFGGMADDYLEILALQVGLDVFGQQFVVFNQQYAVFHIPHPRQS